VSKQTRQNFIISIKQTFSFFLITVEEKCEVCFIHLYNELDDEFMPVFNVLKQVSVMVIDRIWVPREFCKIHISGFAFLPQFDNTYV